VAHQELGDFAHGPLIVVGMPGVFALLGRLIVPGQAVQHGQDSGGDK